MQISDEGSHKACFADAGRQREAKGWELALKVGNCRELTVDGAERPLEVGAFPRRHNLSDPVENFERGRCGGRRLRRPAIALTWRFITWLPRYRTGPFAFCGRAPPDSSVSAICSVLGGAFGRFSTFRL